MGSKAMCSSIGGVRAGSCLQPQTAPLRDVFDMVTCLSAVSAWELATIAPSDKEAASASASSCLGLHVAGPALACSQSFPSRPGQPWEGNILCASVGEATYFCASLGEANILRNIRVSVCLHLPASS